MTFNAKDYNDTTLPKRSSIVNSNGVTYTITEAKTIVISSSLSLSNFLLVPFSSNKLMFIGHVAKELQCCVLVYHKNCRN